MDITPRSASDGLDELRDLRATVRRFVQTELVPNEARWARQQHVDRATWEKAGALGLLLADIPEVYGGAGGSVAHQVAIAEEFAQRLRDAGRPATVLHRDLGRE